MGNGAIGRDITKYKKMQEELTKMQKLEATGLFAGGIAHDFNNLLHIIIGNISLLTDTPPVNEDYQSVLTEIEIAALRARDLTKKFVTFSSGGDPLKSFVDVNKIVDEVKDIVLSGANIKTECLLHEKISHVEVDIGQFRQVLVNLLNIDFNM